MKNSLLLLCFFLSEDLKCSQLSQRYYEISKNVSVLETCNSNLQLLLKKHTKADVFLRFCKTFHSNYFYMTSFCNCFYVFPQYIRKSEQSQSSFPWDVRFRFEIFTKNELHFEFLLGFKCISLACSPKPKDQVCPRILLPDFYKTKRFIH